MKITIKNKTDKYIKIRITKIAEIVEDIYAKESPSIDLDDPMFRVREIVIAIEKIGKEEKLFD